jgi:ADP-ribosylglycohydrolase
MARATLESKIRGCVLGMALGDAIGGPFEFGPLARVPALTGGTWIDGLYPYKETTGPHGVWPCPPPHGGLPPAGTGTDDVRLNWLLLDLATDLGRMPTPHDLAKRYVEIYEHPEPIFPGHVELARQQFAHFEGACRGYLGQTSEQFPDLTPELLLARSLGLNFPILSGLFSLTIAGVLYPGQPVEAYRAAFLLAFFDIGYAREATALLAASIGTALGEDIAPKALFDRIVTLDPLHLGGEFSEPYVKAHLPRLYPLIAEARSDQETARVLSLAFRRDHPFDPVRTLGTALLSVIAADGDPLRAILIAVNHVGIDDAGQATRYEDIDCYGAIAGAIAGAISGAEAFPAEMLEQVVESNKAVYGIDLAASISRFCERFLC